MLSSRKPFRINIGFLINQPIGYTRALPFDFEEIKIADEFHMRDLVGTFDLIRTQDGFRAQAVFDGKTDGECGRCLEPYQNALHLEFEEFFTFPYVESSDEEIKVPEDGNIDLGPILYDYMLMEMPINPLCQPNCIGLCDICGQNLNHDKCEHDLDRPSGEIEKDKDKKEKLIT